MARSSDDYPTNITILTASQISEYHDRGFVVLKRFFDEEALEAMRELAAHTVASPSGLVSSANGTHFCGFSLHNHLFIPEWRKYAYRMPLEKVAAQLLESQKTLYAMDIFHSTTPHCGNESVGKSHSDHNQSPFSIEKNRNFGDNMLVAWIALDRLDEITMDLFPGSHRAFDEDVKLDAWSEPAYCNWWQMQEERDRFTYLSSNSQRINLEPGDVALFQGLTFHQVRKTANCKLETCRRITVRYLNGDVTRWRDDVEHESVWPIVRRLGASPGELAAARLPIVHNTQDPEGGSTFGPVMSAAKDLPVLPGFSHWIPMLGRLLLGEGVQPEHIINVCPHRRKNRGK